MPYDPDAYRRREAAAVAFLAKWGIAITVEKVTAAPLCPTWGKETPRGTCRSCGSTHGDHYRVTVIRSKLEPNNPTAPLPYFVHDRIAVFAFDFWGSYTDTAAAAAEGKPRLAMPRRGRLYTAAEVVDHIVSDAQQQDTDPDEVYREFGPMEPSRCLAIVEHTRRMREVIPPHVAEEARAILDGLEEEPEPMPATVCQEGIQPTDAELAKARAENAARGHCLRELCKTTRRGARCGCLCIGCQTDAEKAGG